MRKAIREPKGVSGIRFSERKRARTVTVEVDVGDHRDPRVFVWEDVTLPRGKRILEVSRMDPYDFSLRLIMKNEDIEPDASDKSVDEMALRAIRHRLEGGRRNG